MRIDKFNQRVILGYGLLTALTMIAGLVGNHYLNVKTEASWRREESLRLADQLLAGSKTLTSNVRAFAATGDVRYRDAFINEQTVVRSRDKAVEGLSRLNITDGEIALIDEAKRNSDQLISLEKRAFLAGESGELQLAITLVYGSEYLHALESIYGSIERFRQQLHERLEKEARQIDRNADMARWVVGILLVLNAAVVYSLLMLFYRRSVIAPILLLNEAVRRRLSGQESIQLRYLDDDSEIGDLARSLFDLCQLENRMSRQRQSKIHVAELSLGLMQIYEYEPLSNLLFSRLAALLDIRCALLHIWDEANDELRCVGGYGLSAVETGIRTPSGLGLAGECARQRKPMRFEDPPKDYLRIVSGTGSSESRELLIRPLMLGEQRLLGVMELAAMRVFKPEDMEFLEDIERVLVMRLANMVGQEAHTSSLPDN